MEAIGIVIPAHDEEATIAACLDAIESARLRLPHDIDTHVVLVLDACQDDTRGAAQGCLMRSHECLTVSCQNVGLARATGVSRVLDHFARYASASVWLAMTDADSLVRDTWLLEHLTVARSGFAAVAGTVCVEDWSGYSPEAIAAFATFYDRHGEGDRHAHVHGANLGVRADAYLAAGGFAPLATGEDQELWHALRSTGARTLSTRKLEVTTSGRRQARAPRGFSSFLIDLSVS